MAAQPTAGGHWPSQAPAGDDSGRVPCDQPVENPRILLVSTLRWPMAARLAIAFAGLGCPVRACCPTGHPIEKTRAVERTYRCKALAPLRSIRTAIHRATPDFIIPCDDNAAIHLYHLYKQCSASGPTAWIHHLIGRSLGQPASCLLATARGELMHLALAKGVRIPETELLDSPADLETWAGQCGFPAVLKRDRSWGGLGVVVVKDIEQARRVYREMTSPSITQAVSNLFLRRDPLAVMDWLSGVKPRVTIQKFIIGRPANRAVACWQGETLAGISVLSLQDQSLNGPATVVRVIDIEEMSEAARRLVHKLELSGLCGMDFVIEESTGNAYLVEVNPRATPIGHLALGAGQDLPAALQARLKGAPAPSVTSTIRNDVIAMFPGEWWRDPRSPYLKTAFHDVPWAEIDLVRECVGLPWEERGIVARARALFNPRRLSHPVAFPVESEFTRGALKED